MKQTKIQSMQISDIRKNLRKGKFLLWVSNVKLGASDILLSIGTFFSNQATRLIASANDDLEAVNRLLE